MVPKVVLFNAVSVDGRTAGLQANLDLFYSLAGRYREDLTLAGSDTILAAAADTPSETSDDDRGGVLVVVDSRGRVEDWGAIKRWPFWGRFASAYSRSTPAAHLAYLKAEGIETVITGDDSVDLRALLEELADRYGARTIRVESGGVLNAALLAQGLVSEVSLLIHPTLLGTADATSIFTRGVEGRAPEPISLKLAHVQRLEKDYVWLRYEVQ